MPQPRLFVIVLFLVAPHCSPSPPVSPDAAEVRSRLERYYADLSRKDWDAVLTHFWPGAAFSTAWQPAGEDSVRFDPNTIEGFVRMAPQGPGRSEIFEEWIIESDITTEENIAQAWIRFGARFGDPGDVAEWEGIDAFALLRVGGEWRIASLVFAQTEGERER